MPEEAFHRWQHVAINVVLECLYLSTFHFHFLQKIPILSEELTDWGHTAQDNFWLQSDNHLYSRPSLSINLLPQSQHIGSTVQLNEVTHSAEAQFVIIQHKVEVLRFPTIIPHVKGDFDDTVIIASQRLLYGQVFHLPPQNISANFLALSQNRFQVAVKSFGCTGHSKIFGEECSAGKLQQHDQYNNTLSASNYLLLMQTAHRQSLLETFINYCLRSKTQCAQTVNSTRTVVRYNRVPIHRKIKQKPNPNTIKTPVNLTKFREQSKRDEAKREKMLECRLMLNITPKAVCAPCESIRKSQVRVNSTIAIKRRSIRAKTEEPATQRSFSPFLTQHKSIKSNQTLLDPDCFEEVNKNRPFTACPTGNNSINRLRTIQIKMPKHRALGKTMTSLDDSLSAWETPFF